MSEPDGGATEAQPREPAAETPSGDAHATPPAPADAPGSHTGRRKPGRYGLEIRFERRADSTELARLVESIVWVNDAHPAYRRAIASRSEGYHLALSVAMALARLAVEEGQVHDFVTAFMAKWGEGGLRK